jgi:hypothetical protein
MNGDMRCELGQSFMARMTETMVPQGGGGLDDQGLSWRKVQGVQGPRAIAPDDHVLSLQILHRTTSRVKLNKAIIVDSKLAN